MKSDKIAILVVEDDEFKMKDIAEIVRKIVPSCDLVQVGDVGGAIFTIRTHTFDLIVLDIALPSRQLTPGGGTTSSLLSGGLEIIYKLEDDHRVDPILVITQYPDIQIEGESVSVEKLAANPRLYFSAMIVGCVRYGREGKNVWSAALEAALRRLK